jgi:hypothetical protein
MTDVEFHSKPHGSQSYYRCRLIRRRFIEPFEPTPVRWREPISHLVGRRFLNDGHYGDVLEKWIISLMGSKSVPFGRASFITPFATA